MAAAAEVRTADQLQRSNSYRRAFAEHVVRAAEACNSLGVVAAAAAVVVVAADEVAHLVVAEAAAEVLGRDLACTCSPVHVVVVVADHKHLGVELVAQLGAVAELEAEDLVVVVVELVDDVAGPQVCRR